VGERGRGKRGKRHTEKRDIDGRRKREREKEKEKERNSHSKNRDGMQTGVCVFVRASVRAGV
jgi:hypothetical protein